MVRKPIVAHSSVVALDVGVLLRLPWLNKRDINAVLLGPIFCRFADVLGAVVAANDARFATPLDELVERKREFLCT